MRRRLEFLPDEARREAAERFWAGAPLSKLIADYADRVPAGGKPLTRTRLAYCLRQELVESGKVARIDPADAAAIAAAFEEDGMDAAWIAWSTGLTPDAARVAAANSDARRPGTGNAAFDPTPSAAELRHSGSRSVDGPDGELTPMANMIEGETVSSTPDPNDTRVARRRLKLWPDPETRLEAAKRLAANEALKDVLVDYPDGPATSMENCPEPTPDTRVTWAKYALMQEAVRAGLVEPINPENTAAIEKSLAAMGLAWTACRTGLYDGAVRKLLSQWRPSY